jgi:hypothetical protein
MPQRMCLGVINGHVSRLSRILFVVVFNLGYAKTSYIKTKHRNSLNCELALILALTKIRPRIEVLAYRKQAQSSH